MGFYDLLVFYALVLGNFFASRSLSHLCKISVLENMCVCPSFFQKNLENYKTALLLRKNASKKYCKNDFVTEITFVNDDRFSI